MTRKVDRTQVRGTIVLSSSHGDRATAQINDLSGFGCNVKCKAPWLRMGCFVSLALSDETTVQGIVRWVRDAVAGVEFLRPIPYADAEALAQSF